MPCDDGAVNLILMRKLRLPLFLCGKKFKVLKVRAKRISKELNIAAK
jgi:hypothetical protein